MSRTYTIEILKNVEKFIRKQNKDTQKRIISAIYSLPSGDVKKLKGLFEKEDKNLKIVVIDIGNRGQIYNRY